MSPTDVLITGIGIVSSLGEGIDAHWRALTAAEGEPALDAEHFAPYVVHPLPEISWDAQIPRRGDQRQMETWQRIGTYAAGLALEDAGIKDDAALCADMDLLVAAGGGERDEAVDRSILMAADGSRDPEIVLNEKLTTELRPTLFLAQLSNLAAGNISIVHKVTGSSRTLMGEEGAGISAIENAVARIRSGQSDHMLVGGAFNAEHPEMLLIYDVGGYLHRAPWRPVWQRSGATGGGIVTGSGGVFLVLELREHAARRNRKAYAQLGDIVSGRARRSDGNLTDGDLRHVARPAAFGRAATRDFRRIRRPCRNGGRVGRASLPGKPRHSRLFQHDGAPQGSAVSDGGCAVGSRGRQGFRPCRPRQRQRGAFRGDAANRACHDDRLPPLRGHGAGQGA